MITDCEGVNMIKYHDRNFLKVFVKECVAILRKYKNGFLAMEFWERTIDVE